MNKDGGIEDILIGESYKSSKKSNKSLIFLFIILIIAIAGGAYGYLNYKNTTQLSKKEEFGKHIANTNINSFLDIKTYNTILERLSKENSETSNDINFSSTIDNELLSDIDISKFAINLVNKVNIEENKGLSELKVDYLSNEIAKSKLITSQNKIAVASDDIVDKYIAVDIDNIQRVFPENNNIKNLLDLKNTEKIGITKEELSEYIDDCILQAYGNLTEENFEIDENFVIEKNGKSKGVTSYSLSLTQDEMITILEKIVADIKSNDELLNQLITGESSQAEENNSVNPTITPSIKTTNTRRIAKSNNRESRIRD